MARYRGLWGYRNELGWRGWVTTERRRQKIEEKLLPFGDWQENRPALLWRTFGRSEKKSRSISSVTVSLMFYSNAYVHVRCAVDQDSSGIIVSQTWQQLLIFCAPHRVATSSCRGHVNELATEPFLLLHREHGTGYQRSWNCCDRQTCFVVIWNIFVSFCLPAPDTDWLCDAPSVS